MIIFIVKRYILPLKKKIPSLIVVLSFLSILLSVSMLIIVTSLMNGFKNELIDKILKFSPHITVHSSDKNFLEQNTHIFKIQNILSIKPLLISQSILIANDMMSGIIIKGVDVLKMDDDYTQFITIDNSILSKLSNKNFGIILGTNLIEDMNIKIGDVVQIITKSLNKVSFTNQIMPQVIKMVVVGRLKTNSQLYDSSFAIINNEIFHNLNKQFDYQFEIKVKNINNLEKTIQDLKQIKDIYHISTWQDENNQIISTLNMQSFIMNIVLFLFVILAIFSIAVSIILMIKDKQKEIAILQSMGLSTIKIKSIFLYIGLLIGIISICCGNFIGIFISENMDNVRQIIEKTFNIVVFDPKIYWLSYLPSKINLQDIITINMMCIISTLIISIISSNLITTKSISKALRGD